MVLEFRRACVRTLMNGDEKDAGFEGGNAGFLAPNASLHLLNGTFVEASDDRPPTKGTAAGFGPRRSSSNPTSPSAASPIHTATPS